MKEKDLSCVKIERQQKTSYVGRRGRIELKLGSVPDPVVTPIDW